MPPGCAVFLTYTDIIKPIDAVGETVGQSTSHPMTLDDLMGMKLQFEQGQRDGVRLEGVADLYKYKLDAAPETRYDTYALVMRGFVDKVLGEGTLARIESELQTMHEAGLLDKSETHFSNVIADFEQKADSAKGHATVVPFHKYEALRKMRNMASVWTMQDHPLVCEQERYFDVKMYEPEEEEGTTCGVAWSVVVGESAGKAARAILFAPGDVCVLGVAKAGAQL